MEKILLTIWFLLLAAASIALPYFLAICKYRRFISGKHTCRYVWKDIILFSLLLLLYQTPFLFILLASVAGTVLALGTIFPDTASIAHTSYNAFLYSGAPLYIFSFFFSYVMGFVWVGHRHYEASKPDGVKA